MHTILKTEPAAMRIPVFGSGVSWLIDPIGKKHRLLGVAHERAIKKLLAGYREIWKLQCKGRQINPKELSENARFLMDVLTKSGAIDEEERDIIMAWRELE